ncbi:MAG: AlwI family type II restriction endonuclease [Bacillales bacterium]|nr:AlwI family type II restriction endonuclease [Bacillales bacterium]
MAKRKDEYKPLLFTTTLRNPERIKAFLSVIAKYNGQILTNEVIDRIVFDLISIKEYVPMYVIRNADLKSQLNSEEPFSPKDTKRIIENSPQQHKEAGFDKGWPSRFDTWYKFLKELGFVYYEMNKPIELSGAGHNLVLANSEGYEHLEQQVFLSSFAKYQRNNPYRRISNKNKPLILLLDVILKLRKKIGDTNAGVHINEIPLFICWKDNNSEALANEIIEIRKNYGFNASDEYIYENCKKILDLSSEDEKRFKISNICHELPDEFIRKMRMTGLISIRGAGRFVDINNQELEKVKYIISNYSELKEFTNEREYFDYVKDIDVTLVNLQKTESEDAIAQREKFMNWVNAFDMDTLKNELIIVSDSHMKSKHDVFKFISEPLRLEFLTALILQKNFATINVKPNYSSDDEGMPTSYAPGNGPDIICVDNTGNIVFEVTLMKGRQQVANEMIPIERHLKEIRSIDNNAFSVFIAPNIHPDAIQYSAFAKYKSNIDIVTLDIPTFVNEITNKTDIRSYRA